ncbi:MAG: hypothetical protein HYU97_05365 [Deltaproteobacteria bacterium]|nr:hypothetical protein [Deltaproteobacteria bacterium]
MNTQLTHFLGDYLFQVNQGILSFLEQVERHEFVGSLEKQFKGCQEQLQRLGNQVASLPQEVSHLKGVKRLKTAIENCNTHLKSAYAFLSLPTLLELENHHWVTLRSYLQGLQKEASVFKKFLERNKTLASRTELQWGRKTFHVASGLFGIWLYGYSGLSPMVAITVLSICLSIAITTEFARHFSPSFNDWLCHSLSGIMRERERVKISSATWFMGSILVIFLCFPREVAILSLFYVTIGDTVAGIVGSRWGRYRLSKHVSIEGTTAAWLTCSLGTAFLARFALHPFHLEGLSLFFFALLGGLTAAITELSFKKLDDNLVMPLLSAPILWLLMAVF